jgi:hypothetical protein
VFVGRSHRSTSPEPDPILTIKLNPEIAILAARVVTGREDNTAAGLLFSNDTGGGYPAIIFNLPGAPTAGLDIEHPLEPLHPGHRRVALGRAIVQPTVP